jgi:thiol-disulfide isomerase/thioredoxin
MKNLIAALMCFWAETSVQAQQLSIKTGSTFAVETHHTYILDVGRGPVKKTQDFILQFRLLSNTPDGYKLSCTMYKAKLWDNFSSSGEVNKFNSDSIRQANTHTSGIVMPLVFLQKTFNVILAPNGKFIRTEGVDGLIQQATAKWHLTESVQEYTTNHWVEFIVPSIKNLFLELPAQKVTYQSAWTNTETNTSYKVTAIAGSLLTITASGTDTLKAKYTLNDVNGLLEDASVNFNKTENGYVKINHQFSHKIIYDKQFAAIDTAWANMAVMLSSWNEKIRPDDYHVDSATVFNYFKTYDPVFKDDRHYNIEKVSLVNQLGKLSNGIYKKLVLETPNKFLSETELQNKMNYIMETDIDQIYDFIKFRSNTTALYHMLQTGLVYDLVFDNHGTQEQQINSSMSQGLTEEKALQLYMTRERATANKLLLLERLFNEKDVSLKQKVVPMYYWNTANKNKQNHVILKKAAEQLKKLTKVEMLAGNGGRYNLFLYKLLADAGLNEDAEDMLDKTITDYEYLLLKDTAYNSSTYNANRNSEVVKNILMEANYLKYIEVNKVDSLKALPYLAKAAQYSPVDVVYLTSASFSDRNLFQGVLRSMGTYRKAYIEKLFSMGDIDMGMKMFATQINVDMGSINDMEKMYQKRFPDKKFSDFVKTNIIATWVVAPAFAAKDIEGKTYKLSDYNGKWLVLDFWGTWCPPCRAEMPEVEKFNQELSAGKHPGIVMLGMADDAEKALTRYLKDNKPTLTSVLGEETAYKYGIKAFPTKCLIAPNGKMILLPSGVNWQKVIIKLNQLYAAN